MANNYGENVSNYLKVHATPGDLYAGILGLRAATSAKERAEALVNFMKMVDAFVTLAKEIPVLSNTVALTSLLLNLNKSHTEITTTGTLSRAQQVALIGEVFTFGSIAGFGLAAGGVAVAGISAPILVSLAALSATVAVASTFYSATLGYADKQIELQIVDSSARAAAGLGKFAEIAWAASDDDVVQIIKEEQPLLYPVVQLLHSLSPSLSASDALKIIDSSLTGVPLQEAVAALNGIRKLITGQAQVSVSTPADYLAALNSTFDAVGAQPANQVLRPWSDSASAIYDLAKGSAEVRAALLLNTPFYATGLAALPVSAAQVSLYSPSTPQGVLTDSWLQERSTFIAQLSNGRINELQTDANGFMTVQGGRTDNFNVRYSDEATGSKLVVYANRASPTTLPSRHIRFGDAQINVLNGDTENDILFGAAGADILDGKTGDDRLEGGVGKDTYIVALNSGLDTILDTDGEGEILLAGSTQPLTGSGDLVIAASASNSFTVWVDSSVPTTPIHYVLNTTSNELRITKQGTTVSIQDFQSGELGIVAPTTPAPLPTPQQNYDLSTEAGDDSYIENHLKTATHNVTVQSAALSSLPNIYGGRANDLLIGGSAVYSRPTYRMSLVGGWGDDVIYAANNIGLAEAIARGDDSSVQPIATTHHHINVDSGDGHDQIVGTDAIDHMLGGRGNDIIVSGAAGDKILADSQLVQFAFTSLNPNDPSAVPGDDLVYAGSGDDYVNAGPGTDTVFGGAGLDVISGFSGNDWIAGGSEDDWLWGDGGVASEDDLQDIAQENNFGLVGASTIAYVQKSNGDYVALRFDRDRTKDGDDTIYGGSGNDRIIGSGGADKLYGEDGNDEIFTQEYLWSDEVVRALDAGPIDARNFADGGAGADKLIGGSGEDTLFGGEGDDLLQSADANDTLVGGRGVDILIGGAGDDTYVFSLGDGIVANPSAQTDAIVDVEGLNTLVFENVGLDDLIVLAVQGAPNSVAIGYGLVPQPNGTFEATNWLMVHDALNKNALASVVTAGKALTLEALVGQKLETIVDKAALLDDQRLIGGAANDLLMTTRNGGVVVGGRGSDGITISGQNNTVVVGKGDGIDLILGSTPTGQWGTNVVEFLNGISIDDLKVLVDDSGNVVIKTLDGDAGVVLQSGAVGRIRLASTGQELLVSDLVQAELGSRIVWQGTSGADTFSSQDGDDKLTGGGGNDVISSGAGDDRAYGDDLPQNLASDFHGSDRLDGEDGDDILLGGGGNDIILGGAGNDWLAGEDQVHVQSTSELTGDDFLDGADGDDTLIGGNGDDIIYGGSGDDSIYGGEGANQLFGEDGNDKIYSPGSISGNSPPDVINGGFGDDEIHFGGQGTVRVDANAGVDVIFGNPAAHSQNYEFGFNPADVTMQFYRSSGVLVMDQNNGSKTFIRSFVNYDYVSSVLSPQFKFKDGTTWNYHQLVNILKSLDRGAVPTEDIDYLVGTTGDDTISGLGGADWIFGGAGNDTLTGGASGDFIFGGAGNDTLISDETAFAGADVLTGGAGDDTYIIRSSQNYAVIKQLPEGSTADLVILENVASATSAVFVYGGGPDYGPGSFIVQNAAGDKRVLFDAFATTSGAILPVLQFADGSQLTAEQVRTRLTASATSGDDSLSGFEDRADTISGGAGSDQIRGLAGDDVLEGGTGNDMFYSEAGSDSYVFNRGDGFDVIMWSPEPLDAANEIDAIRFGAGVLPSEISVRYVFQGGSPDSNKIMEVAIAGSQDKIHVFNQGVGSPGTAGQGIERIEFANGTVWNMADIQNRLQTGTAQSNIIHGSELSDSLQGLGGADYLYAGAGNDTLDGGAGDDYLQGGDGIDTYLFGATTGADFIDYIGVTNRAADDLIRFAADVDPINVSVRNVSGNTVLTNILTGASVTVYDIFGSVDKVEFANGAVWDHTILRTKLREGTPGDDTLMGTTGDDVLDGGAGNDTLYGDQGADLLKGGTGNDRIFGHDGDDIIEGGQGDDELQGQAGNDIYRFRKGDGHDRIFQGNSSYGQDRLELVDVASGDVAKHINFSGDLILKVLSTGDTIKIDADARGSLTTIRFADNSEVSPDSLPTYTNAEPVFNGGLAMQFASEGEEFSYVIPAGVFTDPDAGDSFTYSFQQFSNPPAWLSLNPTTGELRGTPTSTSAGDIVIQLRVTDRQGLSADASNFTIRVLDAIFGTEGADTLNGNSQNNVLWGYGGDDRIDGKAGIDVLRGGLGNDVYVVDTATDTIIELAGEGTDRVESSATLTLGANVENLTLTGSSGINGFGNELANVLTGNSGANRLEGLGGDDTLNGGSGADTMLGGAGDDAYVVDNTSDVVTELASEGTDRVDASVSHTLSANVENLTLTGSGNNNATGNALANVLTGNAGTNRLDGLAGADTMIGGAGNDTYVIDNVGDVVTELASGGTDTVESSITYTLSAEVEKLTLTGSGNIDAIGNTLANTLTGNSGNNVLNGGDGADTMIGGAGNDTYIVDNASDVTTEGSSAGTDLVTASVNWTLATNLENLTLSGTANLTATGNGVANVLTGNAGDNTLNGGAGADTMIGGAGNDGYVVDSATDVITELAGEGTDSVSSSVAYTLSANVENLTLTGTTGLAGTGNSDNNVITGNSGANTLTGAGGDDTLDGGAGNDTLVGGQGNDAYFLDNASDVITEASNEGTDTVNAGFTYTLSTNLENLTLTGTSAVNGTGNGSANILLGNSGVNTLTGNGGNDTLDGKGGVDSLVGGTGNDDYKLGRGYGADTVTENDATAGNTDIAWFDADIAADQLWFRQVGNNLEVSVIGTSDKFTINNWYQGSQYHLEQFKSGNGKTLTDTNVQNLVQAMAAFSPPAAGQTTLPANYATSLNPVIVANWQ
jgi:Ca2+-binding RTX toxin-like protein